MSAVRRKLVTAAAGATALLMLAAAAGCGSLVAITSFQPCTNPGPLSQADKFALSLPLTTNADGLKYADISIGCGHGASRGSQVSLQYTGWLSTGNEFDTSRLPNRVPLTFRIGGQQIIPGLEEGALGMKVGGKRRLVIPPELAFGSQGRPPVIPPDATIYMTVELVALK